jgi:hypothetical protein
MAATRPSWEGHDSPDDEEHTFVGSCEEVSCGEDGQWGPGNLVYSLAYGSVLLISMYHHTILAYGA